MNKRKLKIKISIIILSIVIGVLSVSIYKSKDTLQVAKYEIESEKINNKIKFYKNGDKK